MSAGFALLQRFLRESSGLALDDDKRYLVENRLTPILRDARLSSLDQLGSTLHADSRSPLAQMVTEALTINETSFFRDKTLFRSFSERLLPALIAARKDVRRLRFWCAGCSTGQEPYSLAMAIDEQIRQLAGWQIEILATDLSRAVVETAQRGLYSQFEVQRGLPVAMLLRNFAREGDDWRISDYLRAKVTYKTQNLLAGHRNGGGFDVIFCRNVLIYFDASTKGRVLEALAASLGEGGALILGAAERIGGLCPALQQDRTTNFVFVKTADQATAAVASPHAVGS